MARDSEVLLLSATRVTALQITKTRSAYGTASVLLQSCPLSQWLETVKLVLIVIIGPPSAPVLGLVANLQQLRKNVAFDKGGRQRFSHA